jgi:hypothetical protein
MPYDEEKLLLCATHGINITHMGLAKGYDIPLATWY